MHYPKPFKCCLEKDGVIVAIGNAGGEDDEYLLAYPYDTIPGKKDKTQCWVAVVPGKRFCVHWGYEGDPAERLNQGLKCYVYIDKIPAAVGHMPPEFVQDGRDMEITGFQRFDNIELPFCFGCRKVTDKDTLSTREKSVEMLGTIEVVVFWARIDNNSKEPEEEPDMDGQKCIKNEELIMKPVLEEEIKIRHQFAASLGDPEVSEAMRIKYKTERVDDRDYRFVFHYAHKDWLAVKTNTKQAGNRPFSEELRPKPELMPNDPTPSGLHTRIPLREHPPELAKNPSRGDFNTLLLITLTTALCTPPQTPHCTSRRCVEGSKTNSSAPLSSLPARRPPPHHLPLMTHARMLKRRAKQMMVEEIDADAWDEETYNISSQWVKKPRKKKLKLPADAAISY